MSMTLLFSQCEEYLVTDIPKSRCGNVDEKSTLLAYHLASRKSFATSIDIGKFKN